MDTLTTQALEERDVGAVIDRRYVLRRPIFRGEVHDVFEAEHGWTQVRVALKLLSEPRNAPVSLRARLLREARVLGTCRHPGLPTAMDAGQCTDFGPYLVTELIEGKGLHNLLLTRERLDVASAIALCSQVADALDHVHKRHVVHRDVKPSNILVTPSRSASGDRVRLIDFGVAAVPQDSDVSQGRLTQHGQILGTRAYMAPEQLLGLDGIDGRCDVYGLAVILYECLTGELPFPTKASEWMQAFATGMKPAPMKQPPEGIAGSLERVIREALDVDPSKRPYTCGELVRRCRAAVGGTIPPLSLYVDTSITPPFAIPGATAVANVRPESRRSHKRAPYTSPARIVKDAGGDVTDGMVEDISEGGVLLVGYLSCEQGDTVTLRVPLPLSGKILHVKALARWSLRRSGQRATGLSFVDAPHGAVEDIRRYVELMST